MADTLTPYDDDQLVRQIESYLRARPTDHMLGCQVRLLFEARAAARRPAVRPRPPGPGVWSDTGSGSGAVIPLPDDNAAARRRGTAWERHDDPREP